MAKAVNDVRFTGTPEEERRWVEVKRHYDRARQDIDTRIRDFIRKDELFLSHIEESGWPYQSLIFDPRTFTTIFEKTSRLLARKPKGRMVPREGGDALGAQVSNALLDFQWDDVERVDSMPMLAKWAQMDMNARKYGASFALVKWHYETTLDTKEKKRNVYYDGPTFKPWNNRDVLCDSAYSSIQNWIQLRDYVTLEELETVNDIAKGKPVYKNLDILRDKVAGTSSGGDTRARNYQLRRLSIKGLTDQRGRDRTKKFRTIEISTEYRKDRWITFAPRHGVILRDIPNPYDHGQIPVVMLKYYPVDDDIYGLSEIEPVERLQKAINSLYSQYLDAINMGLYPILKVQPTGVQMHTLEWGPGKKWLMDNPDNVTSHEQTLVGVSEFASTYRFLVSAFQEGMGESSGIVSTAAPGAGDKTATEIRDTAASRLARDNFNQIFLSEAIKKQMMFWHKMNGQFMFSNPDGRVKVIRIVGKDAIRYFQKLGLDKMAISDEAVKTVQETGINLEEFGLRPEDLATDAFPVDTKEGILPKFTTDSMGEFGFLLIEPQDLSGTYDYIPDVESMELPSDSQVNESRRLLIETLSNQSIQVQLQQEGYNIKTKELMEDFLEELGLKDADKYFERLEGGVNAGIGQPDIGGEGGIGPSPAGAGVIQPPGVEGDITTIAAGQA